MAKLEKYWWKKAVVYEIYPRSFYDSNGDGIGDLKGITEKMDYLERLGVNTIWLAPVYKSPMVDNGYDIEDYYAVNPEFGTMADVEELLRCADAHGIRVILDMVINHCSDKNAYFRKALEDPEGREAGYFYFRKGKDGLPPNNWRSIFGGSAWEKVPGSDYYYLHIFAKGQPDLNWENPELREKIYTMMNWWLDKGIAGFRMDAITYIKKEPGLPSYPADGPDGLVSVKYGALNRPGIGAFLSEMRDRTYGRVGGMTVGETGGVSDAELPDFVSLDHGYFSMIFDFSYCQLHLKAPNFYWYDAKQVSPDSIRDAMFHAQVVAQETGSWIAPVMENHDSPRQIDLYLPPEGRTKTGAKMLALLHMMRRGTPFLYQGQEIGMRNIHLPSIDAYDDLQTIDQYRVARENGLPEKDALERVGRQSRDNARTPFQWDDSPLAGFTDGKPWLPVNTEYPGVNVKDEESTPDSLLRYWQELIRLRLRSEYTDLLTDGTFEPLSTKEPGILAYRRKLGEQELLVYGNWTGENRTVSLPDGKYRRLLTGNPDREPFETIEGTLSLQPFEGILLARTL